MRTLIDLYSDTKTVPTPGMRNAMANATVGDEQANEDPTTLELCRRVSGLLGKEQGIFLPSGTMCNLVAILTHTRPGDEILCDERSHIYATEAAGAAVIAGVSIRPIHCRYGLFGPAEVANAVRLADRTAPRSAMLAVEQTTNFSGGAIWPLDQLRQVRDVAKAHDLLCHMDGARLLNAVAATGISAQSYASGWDSVWIDLTKGLGCPVGAVLCGSASFIRHAWQWKYRLGGAMRQSGVLAAAGLYALDHHIDSLRTDHANALLLWKELSACRHFCFEPAQPESNILRFTFSSPYVQALEFAARCLVEGVRIRSIGGNYIRATTHLDVTSEDVITASHVMRAVAESMHTEGEQGAGLSYGPLKWEDR